MRKLYQLASVSLAEDKHTEPLCTHAGGGAMAMREAKPAAAEAASCQLAGRFCVVHVGTCAEVSYKAAEWFDMRSARQRVDFAICRRRHLNTAADELSNVAIDMRGWDGIKLPDVRSLPDVPPSPLPCDRR